MTDVDSHETMDRGLDLLSDRLRATLLPAGGGRFASLELLGDGDPIPVLTPLVGEPHDGRLWASGGAYPLFPYANRVRDARIAGPAPAELRPHPACAPHSIHGSGHIKTWVAVRLSAAAAEMTLDSAADADWPWPYRAVQRIALHGATLTVGMSLENRGTTPMPAGLGWHPYFTVDHATVVRVDAGRRWDCPRTILPPGTWAPPASDRFGFDPAGETTLLSRWTRPMVVEAGRWRATLEAEPLFDHLVIYRPASGAFICAEPQSHLVDGFNLAAAGIEGTGTHILAPGQTIEGTVRMSVAAV